MRRLTVAITDARIMNAPRPARRATNGRPYGRPRPDADAQMSPRGRRKELKVVAKTEPGDARRACHHSAAKDVS